MPLSAPPSAEPLTRGTHLHSQREAILATWGEAGLRQVIDVLTDETRHATAPAAASPLAWYPTRYLVEWGNAIFAGPAGRDEQAFRANIARSTDLGFGRVRRVLMGFATPIILAQRAAELWRHDHTHGTLALENDLPRGLARLTLRDHPFTADPVSRLAIAEVFRHILSRSRANAVRETHAVHDGVLVVTLHWE